jgi:hypothetical protein
MDFEALRERVARLEENMKSMTDIENRLRQVEKSIYQMGGALALLQFILSIVGYINNHAK